MDENKKMNCIHEWTPSGIWDGVDLQGNKTGGQMYRCQICGDQAKTDEEIAQKGGKKVVKPIV